MSISYVGLDFETTGTDPWGLAAPIQLGIALPSGYLRTELIGRWDWNKYEWNKVSEEIHKIPKEEIDKAPPVWQVDILMAADLIEANLGSRMFTVAVGWNVGSFDRQFITRHMPALNRVLSYRNADLNSMLFALVDNEKEYESLKHTSKEYAAEKVKTKFNLDENWHDAGYDAAAALFSLEFLQDIAKNR